MIIATYQYNLIKEILYEFMGENLGYLFALKPLESPQVPRIYSVVGQSFKSFSYINILDEKWTIVETITLKTKTNEETNTNKKACLPEFVIQQDKPCSEKQNILFTNLCNKLNYIIPALSQNEKSLRENYSVYSFNKDGLTKLYMECHAFSGEYLIPYVTAYENIHKKCEEISALSEKLEKIMEDDSKSYEVLFANHSDFKVLSYKHIELKKLHEIFNKELDSARILLNNHEDKLSKPILLSFVSPRKKKYFENEFSRKINAIENSRRKLDQRFARLIGEYKDVEHFICERNKIVKNLPKNILLTYIAGQPNVLGAPIQLIKKGKTEKVYNLIFDGEKYNINYDNCLQTNDQSAGDVDLPPKEIHEFLKNINSLLHQLLKPKEEILNYYDNKQEPILTQVLSNANKHISEKSLCTLHIESKRLSDLTSHNLLDDIETFKEILRANLVIKNLTPEQQKCFWDNIIKHCRLNFFSVFIAIF